MPSPDVNGIPSKLYSTSSSSLSNLKRTNEDLRKHVAKLKMELDAEKARSKQIHRDKVAEVKKLKDYYDQERLQAMDTVAEKSRSELEQELKKMKESLLRSKEAEIKQILKFKEEELKTTRRLLIEERECAVKAIEEKMGRESSNKQEPNETEKRLSNEVRELRKEKSQCEEMLRQHASAEIERNEAIKRLRSDHEKELQRIARENRKEFTRKLNEIKSCQRVIQERNQELSRKEQLIAKLEHEKLQLTECSNGSFDNTIMSPMRSREERSSIQASSEYCSKLERRILDLKRRNGELVTLARKLEEKGKKLQDELSFLQKDRESLRQQDGDSLENLKRTYTMQRARDISEHAKIIMAKDKEISRLKSSIRNGSKQEIGNNESTGDDRSRRRTSSTLENTDGAENRIANLEGKIALYAKERLFLERQLASPNVSAATTVHLSELEKLKHLCSKYESEKEKLQMNFNDLFDKHRKCKNLVDELKERNEECELLKSLLQKSEQEVDRLSASLDGSLEECESLKRVMEKQAKDYETLKSEKDKSQHALKILQNKTIELQQKVDQLTAFEDEAKQLRIALENSRNMVSSLQHKIDEIQKSLEQLQQVERELETVKADLLASKQEYNDALDVIEKRDQEILQLHRAQHEYEASKETEFAELTGKITDLTAEVSTLNARKCKCSEYGNSFTSPDVSTKYLERSVYPSADHSLETELDPERDSFDDRDKQLFDDVEEGHDISTTSDDVLDDASKRIAALAVSDTEEDDEYIEVFSLPDKEGNLETHELSSEIVDPHESLDNNENSINDEDWTKNKRPESLRLNTTSASPVQVTNCIDEGQAIDDLIFSEDDECDSHQEKSESGPITVYTAKHNYDPFVLSPNRVPEVELAFQAGDKLYVFGEKREDGFYLAELMNGDRGLIPSNYVEKVADQQNILEPDDPLGAGISVSEDLTEAEFRKGIEALKRRESSDEFSLSSLSFDSGAEDDEPSPLGVPQPQWLILERQLSNSIVLSWRLPRGINEDEIKGYSVYMNDVLKQTVIGPSRTKALISDVDPDKTYLAAVTTLTHDGKESSKADAAVVIGREILCCPQNVQVKIKSGTSAAVSWQTSNSWQCHAVFVDDQLRTVTGPNISSYLITGLSPDSTHEVAIQGRLYSNKNLVPQHESSLTITVQFNTPAPKQGLDESVREFENMLRGDFDNESQEDESQETVRENPTDTGKDRNSDTDVSTLNQSLESTGENLHEEDEVIQEPGNIAEEVPTTASPARLKKDDSETTERVEVPQNNNTNLLVINFNEKDLISDVSEISEASELSMIKEETEDELLADNSIPESVENNIYLNIGTNQDTYEDALNRTFTIDSDLEEQNKTYTLSNDMGPLKDVGTDERDNDVLENVPELPYDSTQTLTSTFDGPLEASSTKSNDSININLVEMENSRDFVDAPVLKNAIDSDTSGEDTPPKPMDVTEKHQSTATNPMDAMDEDRSTTESPIDTTYKDNNKSSTGLAVLSDTVSDEDEFEYCFHTEPVVIERKPGNEVINVASLSESSRDDSIDLISNVPPPTEPKITKDVLRQNSDDNYNEDVLDNMYFRPKQMKLEQRDILEESDPGSVPSAKEESLPLKDSVDEKQEENPEDDKQENAIKPTERHKANLDFNVNIEIRVFVALFSYDPSTMSPNPDTADEELKFEQGELIKVYGDMDDDGFYLGEIGDRQGFVPSNMVQEVNLKDFGITDEIPPPSTSLQESDINNLEDAPNVSGETKHEAGLSVIPSNTEPPTVDDENDKSVVSIDLQPYTNPSENTVVFSPTNPKVFDLPPKKMVAMYDYDPQELSPNVDSEIELGFHSGDMILVFGDMDEDGFYVGKINDRSGLVPSNFLRPYVETTKDENREIEIVANAKKDGQGSSRGKGSEAEAGPSQKKKKKGFLKKSKQIFSKWKGK